MEVKNCNTCISNRTHNECARCWQQSKYESKQPEETMSDKIQMTDKQARDLFKDIGIDETMSIAIKEAYKLGYIIKPEIEQKIEEVEKMEIKNDDLKIIYKLFCDIEEPRVVLTNDLKEMMRDALDIQKSKAEIEKDILQRYGVEGLE